MAHAHADAWAKPPMVAWIATGEVEVAVGAVRMRMTRKEAVQLAADLLNAAEAQPAEGQA